MRLTPVVLTSVGLTPVGLAPVGLAPVGLSQYRVQPAACPLPAKRDHQTLKARNMHNMHRARALPILRVPMATYSPPSPPPERRRPLTLTHQPHTARVQPLQASVGKAGGWARWRRRKAARGECG